MPLNCDPKAAAYRRILVICPQAIADKYKLGIYTDASGNDSGSNDIETFSGTTFLRLWPRPYTPVTESRIEYYGSTGHPKVTMGRYGFSAQIEDDRRTLYRALTEIMVNSYTTALPKGSRWRAPTIIDFCNPGPRGYESGTDELDNRYIIRHGSFSLSNPGMERKAGLSGGFTLEFKSHQTTLAPGYAIPSSNP
jgi:hypothetical protein